MMLVLSPVFAEALANVDPSKRVTQCAEWLKDHNTLGMAAKQGHCDEMIEITTYLPGVEDERRAKILRLLGEVCKSTDIDAWFGEYASFCMGAK